MLRIHITIDNGENKPNTNNLVKQFKLVNK